MRKFLVILAMIAVLGSFIIPKTAEAYYVEITNLIFGGVVYSPDANNSLYPQTTYVNVGTSGSVSIGYPVAYSAVQPAGIYGVGVPLAPLGLVPAYNLAFDKNMATWDHSGFDVFAAVITKGGYLWQPSITLVPGGYTWGGLNDTPGDLEFDYSGDMKQATIMVTPASDYYLNIVLDTGNSGILHHDFDNNVPSWGTFSDVKVEAVPEPSSMLLLGMGILGLFGLGRKKIKV